MDLKIKLLNIKHLKNVDKSDAIAIMHPDNKFSSLNTSDKFVIDNWGVLDGN